MIKQKNKLNNKMLKAKLKKTPIPKTQKRKIKKQIKEKRKIHKKVVLHPAFIFVFVAVLVIVVNTTYKSLADTIITATIEAPPLNQAAYITSPTSGTVYDSQNPVTITGTCPDNSYIEIYDNNLFSGTVLCNSDNIFGIQISLFSGDNTISANDYNVTDQPGPTSPTIDLTQKIPHMTTTTVTNNQTSSQLSSSQSATNTVNSPINPTPSTYPALLLTSAFKWETFIKGNLFKWNMDLEGGTPPYNVSVNWGDGSSSSYYFKTDPLFAITHKYEKSGYFPIKVLSDDSKNNQKLMVLSALINSPGSNTNFFGTTTPPPPPPDNDRNVISLYIPTQWLWVAWPSIIIIGLMTFSFWLGEREDRRLLMYQRVVRKKVSR